MPKPINKNKKEKAGKKSVEVLSIPNFPSPQELKNKPIHEKIFIVKTRLPYLEPAKIARGLGVSDTVVRFHLKGALKTKLEDFFDGYNQEQLELLRNKALSHLHNLLDDPMTPHAVKSGICKFLLDKFVNGSQHEKEEVFELHTFINETGTISQTKRKITTTKSQESKLYETEDE